MCSTMQSKRRRKRKSPKESKPPPKFSRSKQRPRRCFCGSPKTAPLSADAPLPTSAKTAPASFRSTLRRNCGRSCFGLPWISHRQEAGSSGVGIQQHRHSAECSAGWEVPNRLPSEQPRTAWFPSARNLCVGHFHSQSSLDQGAGNLKFGCLSRKGGLDIRIGQPLLTQFLELQLALLWRCKCSRQGPHRVAGHGIPRRGGFPEAGGCRVVQVGRCSPEGLAPRQIP